MRRLGKLFAVLLMVGGMLLPTATPADAAYCNYYVDVYLQDRHDGYVTEVHDLRTFGFVLQNLHVKDKGWNYDLGIGPLVQAYDIGYDSAYHPSPYIWQWATAFNMGGGYVKVMGKVYGILNDGSYCENFTKDSDVGYVGQQALVPNFRTRSLYDNGLFFESGAPGGG